MITTSLRRKFIKDNGLPIQSSDPEHFKYFMALYDPVFGCIDKYKQFVDTVVSCGGESGYSNEVTSFVEQMVAALSSTEAYNTLSVMGKVSDYKPKSVVSTRDIYHADYANSVMISIDLKSANFNALKSFDDAAVLGAETYDELAYRFTNYEYIANNKQIRQVVFGKVLPTKQIQIQKATIQMMCDNILSEYPYFELSIMGSDEIIVTSYGDLLPIDAWLRARDCIIAVDNAKCEIFTLRQVHPERHYFVRLPWNLRMEDYIADTAVFDGYGHPVFKSVPSLFFAQVYKAYFGIELCDTDLTFIHEGCPAKFMTSIYGDKK